MTHRTVSKISTTPLLPKSITMEMNSGVWSTKMDTCKTTKPRSLTPSKKKKSAKKRHHKKKISDQSKSRQAHGKGSLIQLKMLVQLR